jgi:hypothetical protein
VKLEAKMSLNERRAIEGELPEFLIRALLHRVNETNLGALEEEEIVCLDDVVEWCVASPICVGDIPELEKAIPGFTDALNAWLQMATYEPQ